MYKIYGGKSVVICFSTQEYRILAQSQPDPDDFVMDVGCSYGHATALLAEKSADALGVDISEEVGLIYRCLNAPPSISPTHTHKLYRS